MQWSTSVYTPPRGLVSMRNLRKSTSAILVVLLTVILVVFLASRTFLIRNNVVVRDSIAYWAAGDLLVHHQNPYDYEHVLELERQQGYKEARPLVLRTPPWSLFMVAVLGLVTPLWAWVVWLVVLVWSLITGMRVCRALYQTETMPRNLFPLVGYLFAPVPACLVAGQMGLVLMLGLVLFFYWEKQHPASAGALLLLPFAKPHLLLPFWIVLIVWVAFRKKYRVVEGFLISFTLAMGFALAFDPNVFRHYRDMLQVASIQREFIPALSGVIRLLFFRNHFWVQFMPLCVALLWSLIYFLKNRTEWDWRYHGPALLVISVLTTPYAWLADEAIVLPAILQAVLFVYEARTRLNIRNKIMLVVFALLNFLLLLILRSKIPFSTGIYFWSSLVWFGWYFYARALHLRATALVAQPC